MKITVNKIIRELEKDPKWVGINDPEYWLIKEAIKATRDIIDEQLIRHKNITIKK